LRSLRTRYDDPNRSPGRNIIELAVRQTSPAIGHLDGETEPYETIAVEKLTPINRRGDLPASISQARLRRRAGEPPDDEIHRALAENLVIFFRNPAH